MNKDAFTILPNPCTCGSAAVKSEIHSSWCDINKLPPEIDGWQEYIWNGEDA